MSFAVHIVVVDLVTGKVIRVDTSRHRWKWLAHLKAIATNCCPTQPLPFALMAYVEQMEAA